MSIIDKLIQMDRESPRRILIIGDPMTDVYIHGRIEECQEGCPKFIEEAKYHTPYRVPGGAKNACCSLRNWKAAVQCPVMSITGCIKTRMMVDNKCVFRHDMDNWDDGLDMEMIRRASIELMYLYKPHAVLLSDYDKGLLTPELIKDIARICAENNIPCVADVKREPNIYKGCILKCNELYQHKYNRELSNLVYDNDTSNRQRLVVTTGPVNPIIWDYEFRPCGLGYFLPPVPVINHVGAGDCFAAHMTLSLAYSFSLKDAAAIGHSAGRVYVQHLHNQPPTLSEIREDMLSGT